MGGLHKSSQLCRLLNQTLRSSSRVANSVPLVPSLSAAAHPASSSFASSTHASFPQARHSGWHTSGIQLSFAASHVSKQDVLPCEGARTVSSVATARAPLAGPGGPSGPLADAAAADEEDDGVIRSGVGSPVHSSRKAAHQSQVDSFMLQHNIKIQYSGSQDVPMPVLTMDQVPFNPSIMKSIARSGFTTPSPIQSIAWPVALDRHNLVGIAGTGSGKTAAFLYPAMDMITRGKLEVDVVSEGKFSSSRDRSPMRPAVVVLVPTRELAMQVGAQAEKFGAPLGIKNTVVYGGAPKSGQIAELRRNKPPIIVATPGRLQDLVEGGTVSLDNVQYMALDEADRMLDMGFEPAVSALVARMPRGDVRQTMLFSATWPQDVRGLAAKVLQGSRNPTMHLYVGNVQEQLVASPTVQQDVVVLQSKAQKIDVLLDYIAHLKTDSDATQGSVGRAENVGGSRKSREQHPRVLVFTNTKDMCEELAWTLRDEPGMPRIAVIHGDKTQKDREFAISNFKSGFSPILVATDVAARGLDVQDVKAVVNWDVVAASRPQDYVHRIGRTGRAGAQGQSLALLVQSSSQDIQFAPALVKIMEQAGQEVPEELRDLAMLSRRGGYSSSSGGRRGGFQGRGGNRGSFGGRGSYGSRNERSEGRGNYGGRGYDGYGSKGGSRDRQSSGDW